MTFNNLKLNKRARRHVRIRAKISGTSQVPRLSVFRSNSHIYAQIVDDITQKTLASSSSATLKNAKATKVEQAKNVGKTLADAAVKAGVTKVVFDRGGFKYHGRIKAVADAAREAGLTF